MDAHGPRVESAAAGTLVGVIGATVALVLSILVLTVLGRMRPWEPSAGLDGLTVMAISIALGWRLAGTAGGGGRGRALAGGLIFGVSWIPAALFVEAIAAIALAWLRGSPGVSPGVVVGLVWAVYSLMVVWFFGSLVSTPLGICWALITRAISGGRSAPFAQRSRFPTVRVFISLVAIGLATATVRAATYAPSDVRCLDLLGGSPTDAAFSPEGDLLAVTLRADPNKMGTVLLLRWPSAEVVASWAAWVGEDVAVAPDGQVYWSAWILGAQSVDAGGVDHGVYTVNQGSTPAWFATGEESPLDDLTWTVDALRGTTPNSHRLAAIPLASPHLTTLMSPDAREIGAFWSSSDGTVTVTGPSYFGTALEVATVGAGTRSVPSGEVRSVGLIGDGRTLVAVGWFDGTRLIDVETGTARLLLRGSQAFVAVSQRGDLAWADDADTGSSRLCTLTAQQLN